MRPMYLKTSRAMWNESRHTVNIFTIKLLYLPTLLVPNDLLAVKIAKINPPGEYGIVGPSSTNSIIQKMTLHEYNKILSNLKLQMTVVEVCKELVSVVFTSSCVVEFPGELAKKQF